MTEEFQRIRSPIPEPNLDAEPKHPARVFLSNIMRRVLAELHVRVGTVLVPLEGDSSGRLIVAPVDETPTDLDVKDGVTIDAWGADQAFDEVTKNILILAEDHPLDIRFVRVAGGNTDTLYVPTDTGIALPLKATAFAVKSHSAGDVCTYQVAGLL